LGVKTVDLCATGKGELTRTGAGEIIAARRDPRPRFLNCEAKR